MAGRHLFLEEIFDLGLTTTTSNGAVAVRTGRVTGQAAPDLVVSYFVFNQGYGLALVSDARRRETCAGTIDLRQDVLCSMRASVHPWRRTGGFYTPMNTPNDPKLSERGARRDGCEGEAKKEATDV